MNSSGQRLWGTPAHFFWGGGGGVGVGGGLSFFCSGGVLWGGGALNCSGQGLVFWRGGGGKMDTKRFAVLCSH